MPENEDVHVEIPSDEKIVDSQETVDGNGGERESEISEVNTAEINGKSEISEEQGHEDIPSDAKSVDSQETVDANGDERESEITEADMLENERKSENSEETSTMKRK